MSPLREFGLTLAAFASLAGCATSGRSFTSSELAVTPGKVTRLAPAATRTGNGVALSYAVGNHQVDHYWFTASNQTGFVQGSFILFDIRVGSGESGARRASVGVLGQVLCMKVDGNHTRIGGMVTFSDYRGIPVGTKMTWSVTQRAEAGKSAIVTASALYSGSDPDLYCDLGQAYPEIAVPRGTM